MNNLGCKALEKHFDGVNPFAQFGNLMTLACSLKLDSVIMYLAGRPSTNKGVALVYY